MIKQFVKTLLGSNAVSLSYFLRGNTTKSIRSAQQAFNISRVVEGPAAQIPLISLGEILGDRKPVIRLSVQKYEDGMLPSEQAMVLLAILVAESPLEILEIGTFMGHTTRQMAENLKDATVHTIDLPEDFSKSDDPYTELLKDDFHLISRRVVGREYKDHESSGRIIQHFGDTATWNFRWDIRHSFSSTGLIHTIIAGTIQKSALLLLGIEVYFFGMTAMICIQVLCSIFLNVATKRWTSGVSSAPRLPIGSAGKLPVRSSFNIVDTITRIAMKMWRPLTS